VKERPGRCVWQSFGRQNDPMSEMQPIKPGTKLGGDCRLKKTADYERVFSARMSVSDADLIVYGCQNGKGHRRVGLKVGKKLGGAVVRSRYKRVLRAAFRLSRDHLPEGYDYVLIPRRDRIPSTLVYQRSLMQLGKKLRRRLGKRP